MASRGPSGPSRTTDPLEDPEVFLRRFWRAMHEWERRTAEDSRAALVSEHEVDDELEDQANTRALEQLREIFGQYCTTAEPKRGIVYSEPPEYDPDAERIVEISPSRGGLRIVTQQTHTGYNHRLVYTLIERPDGWRLRDNRAYIDEDGKERPWDL